MPTTALLALLLVLRQSQCANFARAGGSSRYKACVRGQRRRGHVSGVLLFTALSISAMWFGLAQAAQNSPHINYMLHCQGCHLAGGIGHPGIVPNMNGQLGRFLDSEAGRAYLVQVPGASQSSLADADLASVLNWMLREFDPHRVRRDFLRFTAAEVAKHRRIKLLNVSDLRRQLLDDSDK